jgi:hypothetical protein
MLGFFSGVLLAVWFRDQGPQRPVYEWMEEDEEETGGSGEEESGRSGEEKSGRQSDRDEGLRGEGIKG